MGLRHVVNFQSRISCGSGGTTSMAGDVSVATKMGARPQAGAAEFRRYLRNRSVHTVGPSVGRLLAKELGEGFALHFGGRPPINPLDVARQIDIEVRIGPA